MAKPLFGCDLDAVLADNMGPLLARIQIELGLCLDVGQLTSYDELESLLESATDQPREWLDETFEDEEFLLDLPLILPTLVALRKIRGMTRGIHIVTARSKYTSKATRAWLDGYGIPYEQIAHTPNKAQYCREKGISYLMEDAPHHALACHELGIGVFLIDQPWNQDVPEKGGLWRISNPLEILGILKSEL